MDVNGLMEMVINSPLLTGLCMATVVALAAGDEINGNLTRILDQLKDLSNRQDGVEKKQNDMTVVLSRVDQKLDTVIERSKEDRARITINQQGLTDLTVDVTRLEDRQRGLTAAQGIFATVMAAIAAFIGSQR